jgi:hypothetical protein
MQLKLYKKVLAIISCVMLPGLAISQGLDLGSWNILNMKYRINSKWSVFGEAQLRSLKFYQQFHYYEYKAGVIYQINNAINFALAAGDYDTYREGGNFRTPKNNDEFRIWPQVSITQPLGVIKLEHRYRAEFRFTSNGFRNRFRYRLGLVYPFGDSGKGFKLWQVGINNEVFLTNREPYFERNRSAISISYRASKHTQLMIGYLHQFDYNLNDETGRDFLQLGYYLELD